MTGYLCDKPGVVFFFSFITVSSHVLQRSSHEPCSLLDLLLHARLAVVDLLAVLATLLGPGEVGDGHDEEGVARIGHTGEGVVPGFYKQLCA